MSFSILKSYSVLHKAENILNKTKILLSILLLSSLAFAFAKEIKIPETEPLFIVTQNDGKKYKDENLSGPDVISLSLMFGMCDAGSEEWMTVQDLFRKMSASLKRYSSLIEAGRSDTRRPGEGLYELELAEKIMEVMYSEVLSKYSRLQTKVDVMFKTGEYNCVSSSLLFMALAKQCGLDARMQETSVHAFVTVHTKDGKSFDVETTNPYGVNPGVKKTKDVKINGTVRYTIIPETYYVNRKEISDRKAVTLVAKNLCADLSERNDFEKGVPLSIAVYEFVTKEKALVKQEMDKMCVNFAAYANQNYEFEKAIDFLSAIIDKHGNSTLLQQHYDDVVYNEAAEYCNNGEIEKAREHFINRNLLTEKTRTEIDAMIYECEAIEKLNELSRQKKYLEAADFCRTALKKVPESDVLKKGLSNNLYNHGVTVHNEVVPLMNSQKYEKALKILQEAQKVNPENSLINEDIKKIKKLLQN